MARFNCMQVPVLETPGGAIRESVAICRYIAALGGGLYPAATTPSGDIVRSQIDAWVDWSQGAPGCPGLKIHGLTAESSRSMHAVGPGHHCCQLREGCMQVCKASMRSACWSACRAARQHNAGRHANLSISNLSISNLINSGSNTRA